MNRVKLLRDLVIGDGSIYRTGSESDNTGCTFSVSHSTAQALWMDWKFRRLQKFGITCHVYQDSDERKAWRLRTTTTQEFRRLWKQWYFWEEKMQRYEKNYTTLLESEVPDEDTLAILFLDNGSRGLKNSYTDYNNGRRWEIEPYIERFKLSVGRRNQDPIVALFASFGIETKKSREGTGNGEVLVGTNHSKLILKNIVKNFLVREGLFGTFGYKIDFVLSMKDAKRLSELAPIR